MPDSVAYFKGGVVAYSQAMPITHGVPADVLQRHGMVSQESATAMAHAIRQHLGADIGIGLTGVLGPTPLEGKPVGLAYLSIASARVVQEQEIRVPPRRVTIKRRVSNTALIELCKLLKA